MSPIFTLALLFSSTPVQGQAQSKPALVTRSAAKVDVRHPLPEYPRPQFVRKAWTNLNGLWRFQVTQSDDMPPETGFNRKITVPYPVESRLSGIQIPVKPTDRVWYRRSFLRPTGARVLVHFGAVNWNCEVWLNGRHLGAHRGGYDAFSFDITAFLKGYGAQHLLVRAQNPTDAGTQPRGKQVQRPGGIFYTGSSGIWQTVWLEPVPRHYLSSVRITPKNDGSVTLDPVKTGGKATWRATVFDGDAVVGAAEGSGRLKLHVRKPKLWSPDHPKLYKVIFHAGKDRVESYFAFREVSVGPDAHGVTRLNLNGRPLFMVGPLDQGFWPDGIYTAPTDAALKYDIEVTKRLGFNMIRKHVKVEPQRWYTWCDRLGILVWQDMPSGDRSIGSSDPDIVRTAESKNEYFAELWAMMDGLMNHPSVVTWVLFNEGWGQFDTAGVTAWARKHDPTRLLDSVTGWADRGVGDMHDWHSYPGPASPKPEAKRAAVLGEFGGLGLVTPHHMWQSKAWGYQSFDDRKALAAKFGQLFFALHQLVGSPGLSAAVYTQTTDVETEANGLMTYDRSVIKVDPKVTRKAVRSVFLPPPLVHVVVPTSEVDHYPWRYTFERPEENWKRTSFNARGWSSGLASFGTEGTPGANLGSRWSTPDIWLRRRFSVSHNISSGLFLRLIHDDDVEAYLDGKLVFKEAGYTGSYLNFPLTDYYLSKGTHTLALHCHQFQGGQNIDAGLITVRDAKNRPFKD